MNRKELLGKVRNCTPNLGWDHEYPELFGKYGFMTCGICETWIWFDENNISDKAREKGLKPLTYASDEELLEMWGMCSSYWLEQYEKWYKRSEEKSSKLDHFIGECERNYFGYDEDGYTDKTIDRIFNSILTILDVWSNKRSSELENSIKNEITSYCLNKDKLKEGDNILRIWQSKLELAIKIALRVDNIKRINRQL